MKRAFLFLILPASLALSQQNRDTVYYDPVSEDYVISYLGVYDSLVTVHWEPSTKIDPSVWCQVRTAVDQGVFEYEYSILNGKRSAQRLMDFGLEIQPVFSDSTHNGWSIHFPKLVSVEDGGARSRPANRFYWAGGRGLGRGIRAQRFRIVSEGLPGIIQAFFRGNGSLLTLPDEGPNADVQQELTKLSGYPMNYVMRKTVGPLRRAIPLEPSAFIDTIASYKHEAFLLGWIKSQGTVTSLDQKLENARTQIQKGNTTSALNILKAFLNEVEALNKEGGKITSEAYALLKFNAEYLIGKLGEK